MVTIYGATMQAYIFYIYQHQKYGCRVIQYRVQRKRYIISSASTLLMSRIYHKSKSILRKSCKKILFFVNLRYFYLSLFKELCQKSDYVALCTLLLRKVETVLKQVIFTLTSSLSLPIHIASWVPSTKETPTRIQIVSEYDIHPQSG